MPDSTGPATTVPGRTDRPTNSPANSPTISPSLSRALDALRGVAALTVVAQHARTYLFADLTVLAPQPLAVRAVYFLTGFGHAAVMVFFVLSGFLVGGSALRSIEAGRFSWRSYLLRRGTRLWVVLIPALVLTALWDHAALLVTAHPATLAVHARTNPLWGHPWTVEGHGVTAFVGNALFLMNCLVPTFGSNGSLWSLANEFSYYILFPLAAIAVIDRRDSRRAFVAVALFMALAWAIEREILEWGCIWLMGTAVARAPRLRLSGRASSALALALGAALVAVLGYDRLTTNDITLARDATIGALCALVLYAVRCAPERDAVREPSRLASPFLALAGFGYTLYLVHEPPLALLREWIIARPQHRWTPSPAHLMASVGIVAMLVSYAYLLSLVTEARTDDVRAWVQRRLGASRPSPTPTWQTLAEG